MDKPRNIDGQAVYVKRIRCQIDNTPVITIAIARVMTQRQEELEAFFAVRMADFAVGIAVCAFDETPSNVEGTNRAVNRCKEAVRGNVTDEVSTTGLFYRFTSEDQEFMRSVGVKLREIQSEEDKGIIRSIRFRKLNVLPDVPEKVKESLARKQKVLDESVCKKDEKVCV